MAKSIGSQRSNAMLRLSNLDRVFWLEKKYTMGDPWKTLLGKDVDIKKMPVGGRVNHSWRQAGAFII